MKKFLLALVLPGSLFAQEPIDTAANATIRAEATNHSQVMHTLHMIADRYGPRLTGSPGHEAAAHWAVKQLTEWGLKNAHLESWDFGHAGWENERASAFILSPVQTSLDLRVAAWTPSTKGTVKAEAVQVLPPTEGSREELAAWLEANKAKVHGKIVLVGKAVVTTPAIGGARRGGPGSNAPVVTTNTFNSGQRDTMINGWLVTNGALVRVFEGGGTNGMIRETHNRTYDATKALPGAIIRHEDFGRIERLLQDSEPVKLEFTIVNHWYPEGKTSYNVVAEIPGTSKPDEVVMVGGHLDSWNQATGATDNGIGSAMMMEVVRIIQQSGLKPRRTVRIGLWSGEEEGLYGSIEYVKKHFGTYEEQKPEFNQLVAYFNIDSGAGSVRSLSIFGPESAAAILNDVVAPFADLGVSGGATNSSSRALGNTDSTSFSAAGLAGVGARQNPTDYGFTHHTSFDTYEHVKPEDVINAATVLAAAVWDVANREERLPRFSMNEMPGPVAPR
jgi:carboxypeptidase Q